MKLQDSSEKTIKSNEEEKIENDDQIKFFSDKSVPIQLKTDNLIKFVV